MATRCLVRSLSSSSSKSVLSCVVISPSASVKALSLSSPLSQRGIASGSTALSSSSRSYSSVKSSSLSSSLFSKAGGDSFGVLLRGFASVEVKVPSLGDSITEGTLQSWVKAAGDFVDADEVIAVLETDKVSVDIRSPSAGQITKLSAQKGETVKVGALLASIDTSKTKAAGGAPAAKPAPAAAAPAAAQAPSAPQPQAQAAAPAAPAAPKAAAPVAAAPKPAPTPVGARTERRVQISRMRKTIADRLKKAQNTSAMLTTFNEIDMSAISELRNKFKDEFVEKHGVKLGFMSAFVRAATLALQKSPDVNAYFEGDSIVYHDFVDVSVAVATPNGLVVPVLRNTEGMGFQDIELAIQALSNKARKGQIALEDMSGGTFTISNGGVYGSLMGTPIINPPQSAILGMHGIFKRPVAVGDKIEIRPMMYVALTYDHRIIDGAGAVTFLKDIKQYIEDPQRMLLGL